MLHFPDLPEPALADHIQISISLFVQEQPLQREFVLILPHFVLLAGFLINVVILPFLSALVFGQTFHFLG